MRASFSRRTGWDLGESSLHHAIQAARATGRSVCDLTLSNPTRCAFHYDPQATLAPLGNPASLTYDPDPRGILSAREAVCTYYAEHGAEIAPEALILTTSTSEAYSFLFRLLCDPGDQVLVAQPSYPLFDFLATLDDVQLAPYPLFYDFGWWIDFVELERRITPATRAVLLVHPNNPTGHATSHQERTQLEALCERHGLALIVDEVFLDYGLTAPIQSFARGPHPCLTFVISGISKIAALPQMKVGWLSAFGPGATEALNRLEVIADTFLSMNAPAQHALGYWLAGRSMVQQQIVGRVQQNLQSLRPNDRLTSLPVQAGWSAVIQLSQRFAMPDLAERLVAEAGVVTHPASFYAMDGLHRLVISLMVPSDEFRRGLENINQWCESKELT